MPTRHFPVRPDLAELNQQALDLLTVARREEPGIRLEDVLLKLANDYGLSDWHRLETACRMTDAIWSGHTQAVKKLINCHPELLYEDARGVTGNWGPPMSYAANLGQNEIIQMLFELGASDLQHAFDRACLQGQLATARQLHSMGARPEPGAVMGPCETLSDTGLKFLLDLDSEFSDRSGDRLAPVALILETYSRNPDGKHGCLELVNERCFRLPDTPVMAIHRGRTDLLHQHLQQNPRLLEQHFSHAEIYPAELGCHADTTLALHGSPLAGGTLLHLCVDYDELELAKWLVAQGADCNGKASLDANGFGGHTPLFGCVVSQPFRTGRRRDDAFARLLLDHGADPNVRASLRKQLRFVSDESLREFINVTPLGWGTSFQDQDWVSPDVMDLIAERGGHL